MYVHRASRLVYLANPRTGSTSTAKALMEIGFEKVGKHHEACEMDPDHVTFAVVRNHWDAALSWVLAYNLPVSVKSLEEALRNEYITENRMWAYHKPDILLRYEDLETGLNDILFTPVKLPRENVTYNRFGRDYWRFYDRETRDYIGNRFKDEIEEMGYRFA